MKIAQVIIHQGVYAQQEPFDYACPEPFALQELVGKRVQIPWKNRPAEGIVIHTFETEEPRTDIRFIQNVMDEEPVLSARMIELARWMSRFYVCSLTSCLRLMIPTLLNRQHNRCYQLSEKGQQYFEDLKKQYPFLPKAFYKDISGRTLSQKEMDACLMPDMLRKLLKEQWLIQTSEYSVRNIRTEEQVYVIIPENKERATQLIGKRAVKQQALFDWILQRGEIPVEEIKEKYSGDVIRSLQDKSLIERTVKSVPLIKPEYDLNAEQQQALQRIRQVLLKQQFQEILLYGVTGSGKTEVYIQAILSCLQSGRNAMLLVPEIALAQQTYRMLKNRIPELALFHSGKSAGERYESWRRVKEEKVRVVIGARSALFAPLENIGLLIVDEEQELSYKSETMPCYHAVEVARRRMQMENGILLLGTATPTMESMRKAWEGETEMLSLTKRISTTPSPVIHLESLRRQKDFLTPLLESKIQERLAKDEQVILFVNRRGYAPRTVCTNCGAIQKCPHCSVAMVYHKDDGKNHCHYCNYRAQVQEECPDCREAALQLLGMGTQKLEALCRHRFPQARIARLDMDAASRKNYHDQLLQQLQNGEVDILIGTQMLAKGLHIPGVSLVGIIDADALLSIPDYRAAERAVQLLLQVSGRAGRADKPGEVVVQTFQPENTLYQIFRQKDYLSFTRRELSVRKQMGYPPFAHLCRIVTRGTDEKASEQAMAEIAETAAAWLMDSENRDYSLIGPAPSMIYKIQNQYRNQLLIKAEHRDVLVGVIHRVLELERKLRSRNIRLEIDFDPVHGA